MTYWIQNTLAIWAVAAASAAACKPRSKAPVAVSPDAVARESAAADAAPVASALDAAPADAAPPDVSTGSSQLATWTCTGNPCPWGATQSNQALVWPAAMGALATRLGYTVSAAIYLPATKANGVEIAVETGTATVHAGLPGDPSHRALATVAAGQAFRVNGLAAAEVVSVQNEAPFRYRATFYPAGAPEAPGTSTTPPTPAPTPTPTRPPEKPPHRPPGMTGGRVVLAIPALWKCHKTPGCFSDPWPGAAITWPAWSAHQGNGRTGNVLRFVYSVRGEPLYPYMGAWAEGCEVTAVTGAVQVVEWQYGAEQWRSTLLAPGEYHIIHLVPPENSALIEAAENTTSFSVALQNCDPKRIAP
jgi:hypothetical protein